MTNTIREYLPGVLNGITGIAVVVVSIFVDTRYTVQSGLLKPLGVVILLVGMIIAVWASVYLKDAILGEVQPRVSVLITQGPFRFVRHPVYLGIVLALVGVCLILQNWLGLALLSFAFIPTVIYRAKLEEKALRENFLTEWQSYAARVSFLLPRLTR